MNSRERREATLRRLASARRGFLMDEVPFAGATSLSVMASHGIITVSIRITQKGLDELDAIDRSRRRESISQKRLASSARVIPKIANSQPVLPISDEPKTSAGTIAA